MSGASQYFCDLVADAVCGRATMPVNVYVALATTEPFSYSTGSTIIEPPSGVGYARQPYQMSQTNWEESSSGYVRSLTAVPFTSSASGEWGTIVCWVITTDLTGGSVLMWGTLDSGVTVTTGAVVAIPVGGMQYGVELASQFTSD